MNAMTCPEVQEQIELYLADACDSDTTAAVRDHLADCPACAAESAEAGQLLGLLDLRLQEDDRLARLRERLAEEAALRHRAPPVLPFVRRAAAVAALLLLPLGLTGWFGPALVPEPASGPGLAVALVPLPDRGPGAEAITKVLVPEHAPAAVDVKHVEMMRDPPNHAARLNRAGRSEAEYRRDLAAMARTDRLPLPPRVDLALELTNPTDRPVKVRTGDDEARLWLELRGPGVLRLAGPARPEVPFLEPAEVELAPHGTFELPVRRLIGGSRREPRYVYWTEPGEYSLTVRYRATLVPVDGRGPAARTERTVTVTLPERTLRVTSAD